MDIGVPSRFACLRIEDDDHRQTVKSKDTKKKMDPKLSSKKSSPHTKSDKNAKNKKISNNKQVVQSSKTKSKKNGNSFQWDEWKIKDDQIVNGNYEQDLQDAILLSKLDYEHNKEMYKNVKEINGNATQQPPNKKKKNKTMSINEFLTSGNEKKSIVSDGDTDTHAKPENVLKDDRFFDDVKNAAKEEFNKELITEKRKKREASFDKITTLAQCQEKLKEEKAKNVTLQVELRNARAEIIIVKERNRALCGILGQGEMKDKADVLLELEKLYSEKNDLTEEVTRLHVQLEQERSKVAALTSDSHKHTKDKVCIQK
uniref:G kinase-anchoring protein 1 n=1 Tax=Photinus pyralis TaxID=7054 RepID=A0A1Y1MGI7_PHOPY